MAEHRWDTSTSAAGDGASGISLPQPRRWLLSVRAAALAVCLLIGTAAGFAVFRGGTPVEVSSVELDPADSSASDAGTAGPSPGTGGTTGAPPAGPGSGGSGSGESSSDDWSSGAAASDGGAASAVAPVLVVHVAGAVLRPGVVRVPGGSRTVDAVDAAGGAAADADLTAVNLAAALQDGSMVVVPRMGDPPRVAPGANTLPGTNPGSGSGAAGTASGNGAGTGAAGLVNLNTATLQELDTLPRVGPVIAERIVAWREAHGAFSRPEDLDAVPGIGEGMLASLLPLVTV